MPRPPLWVLPVVACAALDVRAADDVGSARLDLVVPDVPAATAVGLAASKVQHPATLKDFAVAALSGLNDDGKLATGFGIEVAPFDLALGKNEKAMFAEELVRSFRMSAATTSSSDAGATAAAGALAARFGKTYNPRTDEHLLRCLASALPNAVDALALAKTLGHPPSQSELDTAAAAANERLKAAGGLDLSVCRAAYQANHLANISFEAGSAYTWKGTTAFFSDLQPAQLSVWVTATYGWASFVATSDADRNATAQAQAVAAVDAASEQFQAAGSDAERTRLQKTVIDAQAQLHVVREETKKIKAEAQSAVGWEPQLFVRYGAKHAAHGLDGQKDIFLAGRLPLRAQTWTVFMEIGHQFTDVTKVGANGKDTMPTGIGGDVRLGDGTWLGMYFSADLNSGQLLSIANLKWSFGDKSPF